MSIEIQKDIDGCLTKGTPAGFPPRAVGEIAADSLPTAPGAVVAAKAAALRVPVQRAFAEALRRGID